jgi:hypothetical protein
VKVFLSYRRRDNPYLAKQLRDVLVSRVGAENVFLDATDISPGRDFTSAIGRAIARTDVLVALIGPGWDISRLHDPDDLVRAELMTARRMGRRVLPVLHSEEVMPRVDDLPEDLAWLAFCNAFVIGSSLTYEDDLVRLTDAVLSNVVALADLREEAWSLYEQSRHGDLLVLVGEAWQEHGHAPSASLAECCRIAAVSSTRSSDQEGRALWWARTVSTAYISGATNVVAASLVPYFFQLLRAGKGVEAREVLGEVRRLLLHDTEGVLPPRSMLLRLYHEKMAYSLFQDGDYAKALVDYDDAAAQASDDARGRLKIDGARALCRYMLGSAEEALRQTEAVLDAATVAGYRDVESAAKANAAAMRAGGIGFTAYEVL